MVYNWQQKDWPHFTYNLVGMEPAFHSLAEKTGDIGGILKALPDDIKTEAVIDMMISEAIKTAEIEGE